MTLRSHAALAFAVLVCECAPPPGPASLIDRARVVAILSDTAVVLPGATVSLRAVVAGAPQPLSFRWWWCDPSIVDSTDCADGTSNIVVFANGPDVSLTVPDDWFARFEASATEYDGGPLTETDRALLRANGESMVVVVQYDDGVHTLRAARRVRVGSVPGASFPGPAAHFGQTVLSPMGPPGVESSCAPAGSIRATAGSTVTMTFPRLTQDHTVFTATACDVFATAGTLPDIPGWPACGAIQWVAPTSATQVSFWYVASDQHGDVSACSFEVEVR